MKITIDEKAKALIREKGAEDLVVDIQKCGGWASVPTPFVVMAKPQDPFRYEVYDVDGVRVHMNKSAEAKDGGVVIYVERFLWIKRLEVRGLKR